MAATDLSAPSPAALLHKATELFASSVEQSRAVALTALEKARAQGDQATAIDARTLLGQCYQQTGDYAAALDHLEIAREGAVRAGDRRREAEVHRQVAATHDYVGNFDLAAQSQLEALKLHEGLADDVGRANLLRTIGVSLSKSKSFEQAIEWYRQSHELARRAGDPECAMRSLSNIGIDLKNLGRLEESLETYQQARVLALALGTPRALYQVDGNMGNTYLLLGRIEDAAAAFVNSLELARGMGAGHPLINALVGLGCVRTHEGRFEEARALLDEAVEVGERYNFRPDLGDAFLARSDLCKKMGDHERALAEYERYHALTRELMQDETKRRLKAVEMSMRIDEAQRDASEQRRRSRELEEAYDRLQAAAAEKEQRAARLERQSLEDTTTGLPNRRHFERRLAQAHEAAKRDGPSAWLLLVAVDRLEPGDGAGTARVVDALAEVASVLRASIEPRHPIAHLGGGQFAMLLDVPDRDTARLIGERLCRTIQAHDWAAVHPWIKPRASAGISELRAGVDAADVFALASASLQASRLAGGQRIFEAPARAQPPDGKSHVQADLILGEQVRAAYANLPLIFGASLVAGVLMCLVVRDVIPVRIWGVWIAALVALAAGALALNARYLRSKPTGIAARRWGHYGTLACLAAGCAWGIGTIVLHVPDSIDYQILVAVMAALVASSAAFALATYVPPFYAFLVPAVVPIAVVMLGKTDATRVVTGLVLAFYIPVVARFAMTVNRAYIESLRLRFQNVALVGELRDKKEAAEGASVAKSRFLAAASHDLRQPMHALGLFLQSLRQGNLGERERQLADNIAASYNAMEALFDALLDISRLDAGVVEPRVATFAVEDLLGRLRTEYEPQAAAKGLALSVRPCRLHVRSDPTLLQEMVGNFFSNAVRHTRSGRIVAGCRREPGGRLRIEVWDTGVGIPADKQREVFRDFVQLGNPERDRRQGLGLGLAIVERLSRLLDHPVAVRSVPGRGSVFSVVVPMGLASDAVHAPTFEDEVASIEPFEGRMVVVVDDDATVLAAMAALLMQWGCEVAAADSGAKILGKLAAAPRRPDLILCDYRLRDGESGVDVIEDIRAEFNQDIPAALITGDTGPERLKEAGDSGLPLLHKPVKAHRLRALMAQLLSAERAAGPS